MTENVETQILSELRKIRRVIQLSLYLTVVPLAVFCAYLIWVRPHRAQSRFARALEEPHQAAQQSSSAMGEIGDAWSRIQSALDHGDYSAALSTAREMTNLTPAYHYAYASLGHVYLAMGDLTNAEAQYAHASELYPIEENDKALAAIRQRLAKERDAKSK